MIFNQTMSYNSNQNGNNQYNPMYGRQESTMSMDSSLGQAYTEDMKNMLETPIDITNYMFDDDWPLEDQPQMEQAQPSEKQQTAQYYQEQVQMQQALYHDVADSHADHFNYGDNNYADYSPNYDHPHIPRPTQHSMVGDGSMAGVVKSEPDEEEYMTYEQQSPSPLPSTSRQTPLPRIPRKDAAKALEEYKPQTKARGYKIKQEEEKADPSYKLKRARNNDAVRKSRTKAKEQQMEREKELQVFRDKVSSLEKENKNLKSRLSKYEKV